MRFPDKLDAEAAVSVWSAVWIQILSFYPLVTLLATDIILWVECKDEPYKNVMLELEVFEVHNIKLF